MRASERDLLLLILAVSAGSADGWSYFGIGHAFVANMTGNTVLLGVDVFGPGGDLLHPAIAIGCYAAGVILAALLTRNVQEGKSWPRAVSATLLIESFLLIGAEVAWALFLRDSGPRNGLGAQERNWLLGGVAFAVGMQSGAMVQLRIPGVVTTYITGTWTSLMSGLARLCGGNCQLAPDRNMRSKSVFYCRDPCSPFIFYPQCSPAGFWKIFRRQLASFRRLRYSW